MNLDFETGGELIKKAYEQRDEELLMQRWLLHYQYELSFEEFKAKLATPKIQDNRTEEEILLEVKGILNSFKGGGSHRDF